MKQKPILLLAISFLAILTLAACGGGQAEEPPEQAEKPPAQVEVEFDGLIFTVVETTGMLTGTPVIDYVHTLTEEQLNAVFPDLGLDITATTYYSNNRFNGTVSGVLTDCGTQIFVGWGRVSLAITQHTFREPNAYSYIHGVPVRAVIFGSPYGRTSFRADFNMEGVAYRIQFSDSYTAGKERMVDLVNRLIQGGPADLNPLLELPPGAEVDWSSFPPSQASPSALELLPAA